MPKRRRAGRTQLQAGSPRMIVRREISFQSPAAKAIGVRAQMASSRSRRDQLNC